MLDYKQFSKVLGSYHVTFSYAYKGEDFSKSYNIELIENLAAPAIQAWKLFEMDMIDEGLSTHECGCCLDDKDLEILDLKVYRKN